MKEVLKISYVAGYNDGLQKERKQKYDLESDEYRMYDRGYKDAEFANKNYPHKARSVVDKYFEYFYDWYDKNKKALNKHRKDQRRYDESHEQNSMPSEPGRRVSVVSEQELKDAELLLGLGKRKSMLRRRRVKKSKSKKSKSKKSK